MSDWEVVPLSDIVERVTAKDPDSGTPVYTVSAAHGLIDQEQFFTKRVASQDLSTYYVVQPGDFVYNKSTSKDAPFGVVARNDANVPVAVTPLYIAFRATSERVDPEYLRLACNSQEFFDSLAGTLREGARAHGLLNVRLAEFFGATVVLPPLDEQRRIVDLIGKIDAHIDALDTEATGVEALAWASVTHRVETSPLAIADDVIEGIEGGRSPMTTGEPPADGQHGVLKVSAVKPWEFVPSEAKGALPDTTLDSRHVVAGGDVLITRANTPERVGAVCLVPDDVPAGLYLCDKTLRISVDSSRVHPAYFAAVMNIPAVHSQLTAAATGTSASMFNVSQKSIRSVLVPMPLLEEQVRIAAAFKATWNHAAALRVEVRRLHFLRSRALDALLSDEWAIPASYEPDANMREVAA